jgi:hypothetical protein
VAGTAVMKKPHVNQDAKKPAIAAGFFVYGCCFVDGTHIMGGSFNQFDDWLA